MKKNENFSLQKWVSPICPCHRRQLVSRSSVQVLNSIFPANPEDKYLLSPLTPRWLMNSCSPQEASRIWLEPLHLARTCKETYIRFFLLLYREKILIVSLTRQWNNAGKIPISNKMRYASETYPCTVHSPSRKNSIVRAERNCIGIGIMCLSRWSDLNLNTWHFHIRTWWYRQDWRRYCSRPECKYNFARAVQKWSGPRAGWAGGSKKTALWVKDALDLL